MWDDEQLLALLKEALQDSQAVPADFVQAARDAYAWHGVDDELAQLSYDSERDRDVMAGVRAETAPIRALTFTSPHLTIELEVGDDSLLGQLVPTGEGAVEVQTQTGVVATVGVDEVGCFPISPIPPSPFRLRCRSAAGHSVITGWITL